MTSFIPIGRFSKMTRLSVKALRLYDEMLMLVPAHVDPSTGYRYYTPSQVRRAVIIGALRAVEMPLEEIRAFVSADDEVAADRWLLAHRMRIEQRLKAHQQMLSLIDTYVGNKPSLTLNEVELVTRAEVIIAAIRVRTSRQNVSQDVPAGFAKLAQGIAQTGLITVGPPMLVYHDFIDEQNDGDMEIAVPIDGTADLSALPTGTPTPADKRGCSDLYRSVLPACTLATIIHRGPFSEIAPTYQRLFEWIHEGDFDIVGAPREVYVTDPATIAPDSLLSRVEVPVAPAIAAEPEQVER